MGRERSGHPTGGGLLTAVDLRWKDRHACASLRLVLNLTNAESISEFVGEVRHGKDIRTVHAALSASRWRPGSWKQACDILRPYPEYPDRRRWIDRFLYRSHDGAVQSLATLWKNREPWFLRPGSRRFANYGSHLRARATLRSFFAKPAEVLALKAVWFAARQIAGRSFDGYRRCCSLQSAWCWEPFRSTAFPQFYAP